MIAVFWRFAIRNDKSKINFFFWKNAVLFIFNTYRTIIEFSKNNNTKQGKEESQKL